MICRKSLFKKWLACAQVSLSELGYRLLNYGSIPSRASTNNTDKKINSCSFFIGFPSGTKYTVWTGNVIVNNGDFSYNSAIDANGNVIIYGQVTLPAGYDINDYLSPSITNIQVS